MILYIARHGESEADLLNVVEGNADYKLTEEGVKQAQALAKGLKEHPEFDAVYSSTLKRASQTADIICETLGKEKVSDARLREISVGDMAGVPKSEIAEKFPVPKGGIRPHQSFGAGTGESILELEFRVRDFISELISKHSNERVLIVTHGGAGIMIMRYLTGSTAKFRFGNCSLACVNINITEEQKMFSNRSFEDVTVMFSNRVYNHFG